MNARRALYGQQTFPGRSIVELKIRKLPKSTPGSQRCLKYGLFYGRPGHRWVGYDNERMNGNHRQVDDAKAPYAFSTPERLVEHFRKDVGPLRGES